MFLVRTSVGLILTALLAACAAVPSPTAEDDALTIGFVFIADGDDLGYNQAIYEGSEALARALPDTRVLRRSFVPEGGHLAEEAMEELIDDGASILFATSYGYREAARRVAERHRDVTVLHQGGIEGEPRLSNFGTYWGTIEDPVYLAGIVAGGATETGRLGFVAAFPIPAVLNNINAFLLGARSVRPDATVRVRFTGSWCAPTIQKTAALELLDTGVDVLTQHQDCTRTILEVAERAGVFSVGYHQDGSEEAPEGYLVGAVWTWTDVLVDIVRTIRSGDFPASPYNGDFRGGYATGDNPFVLSEMSSLVPRESRAMVRAAEQRLLDGWSPFAGPLADRAGRERVPPGRTPTRQEIEAMDYVVEGVLGAVPPR